LSGQVPIRRLPYPNPQTAFSPSSRFSAPGLHDPSLQVQISR
jgi:hypothetical protein